MESGSVRNSGSLVMESCSTGGGMQSAPVCLPFLIKVVAGGLGIHILTPFLREIRFGQSPCIGIQTGLPARVASWALWSGPLSLAPLMAPRGLGLGPSGLLIGHGRCQTSTMRASSTRSLVSEKKPPGRKGVLSKPPAQCPNQKTNVTTLISMTQRVPNGLWFFGLGLGTHLAPPIKTPHMVGPTEA